MERLTRDEMLMEVADVVAKRGTCSRLQVGAVFAKEGRILVTGYNGAPPGIAHCVHESYTFPSQLELEGGDSWYHDIPSWAYGMIRQEMSNGSYSNIEGRTFYSDGSTASTKEGCGVAEHAERNAIGFAARHGISLMGTDLYCTHAPCLDCARALVSVGVSSVTYRVPYRRTGGVELLRTLGIEVIDLSSDD